MMKVKRFNNLWTMGLILFGSLLVLFYIAKIFFPQFIISVAETPNIVKLGNYVDTHKWAFYIYHLIVSYIIGYVYCCACCRKMKLNLKENLVLFISIILVIISQEFLPEIYSAINYTIFVFAPFIMLLIDKNLTKETFCSTIICYVVDIMTQAISLFIRNIIILSTCVNSATMTILLIDMVIWRCLLYFYYNYKKEN